MELSYQQVREAAESEMDVWCMAFEKSNSKHKNRCIHCPPVKGKIMYDSVHCPCFYPYGKRGGLVLSRKREILISQFYDNEEECILEYNKLIQQRLDELYEQIDELNKLMK